MKQTVTHLDGPAKDTLRKAVRGLRAQLVSEISAAAEGEYQLGVELSKARLPEARRVKRERLEHWIAEQERASGSGAKGKAKLSASTRRAFLERAVTEAAHTLLHRLVLLRILEHHGLVSPKLVTGGWNSPAFAQEFTSYAGPLKSDDTLGYQALLDTVFAELALELPGVFGPLGLTPLFSVPAATLRDVINVLNDPALASAWGDDTTLGWVYQYWNDPDREALDKKIADGGKIGPSEIAQKTQMFTERYMVEWLLQNSLGLTWLSLCKKNGWRAEAEAVLPELDARRAAFRAQREAGEVTQDALMPVADGLESHWKYYVPQPLPEGAVERAPSSLRELKLLDPACGSGHFLVIAFDLLAALYEEEARHRQLSGAAGWSRAEIAENILGSNLHGIDLDARAIQIAAAALWLKAKLYAPEAQLGKVNLVAPQLRLAQLPAEDPSWLTLRADLEQEVGIPPALTDSLVKALAGVDHLGTLLRVDRAAEEALLELNQQYESKKGWQGHLVDGFEPAPLEVSAAAKLTVLDKLERFLSQHSAAEDVGLRLGGEQLAAGARFIRMVRPGSYDIVVGNPPYQGLSKTAQFDYVVKNYPRGKADLFAAFLERGLELVREGGISAMLAMRAWMFLGQYEQLRKTLVHSHRLIVLGDLDKGAFEEMTTSQLISVCLSVIQKLPPSSTAAALQPTAPGEKYWGSDRTDLKRAALLVHRGRYEFDPKDFVVVEGEPIVYWWSNEQLGLFRKFPLLGAALVVAAGVKTGDDIRFVRLWYEASRRRVPAIELGHADASAPWQFYIKGAAGAEWIEPASQIVAWDRGGLELKIYGAYVAPGTVRLRDSALYFRLGIAFSPIGASFSARVHRLPSIFGNMGSSVFAPDLASVLCTMNATRSREIIQALNPGLHFENDDVKRLPLIPVPEASAVLARIEQSFTEHESHREPSVEFLRPGPSAWKYAQAWAQLAVDRPEGAPLPPYEPSFDPPEPAAPISFAIGVALGRFGADGEGILEQPPATALSAGILFVGPDKAVTTKDAGMELPDGLDGPTAAGISLAWEQQRAALNLKKGTSLRDWLRKDFFAYHKALYENRPIYFPLSSEKKTFVAWISIHRWTENTLQTLLADHLNPILRKLDGAIADLAVARASSDKAASKDAEARFTGCKRLREELFAFAEAISLCAERGAPPSDPSPSKCKPRAVDAPFIMDLDDGVMINSAALWPLLSPQWNDPKKWWAQLCNAEGKKDYDWSHLARRYFPMRVEEKCQIDPSLAVAHGCFWKYHPAKAFAWELRLQDEIRPDFTIDEKDSDALRARFLQDHPEEATALRTKETARRERAKSRAASDEEESPNTEPGEGDESEDA